MADTAAEWRAICPTDDRGWVWVSICSLHQRHNLDCHLCQAGQWCDPDELVADSALFRSDYAAWFRKNNNGAEPTEQDWEIRRMFDKPGGKEQ